MTVTYLNAIPQLLESVPEFKEFENFKDIANDGNASLQYVVYGVLNIFYCHLYEQKKMDTLAKLSNFLEEVAKTEDKKLRDLLLAGFLEGLDPYKDYYRDLRKTFGPKTRELLTIVEGDMDMVNTFKKSKKDG